MEKKHYGSIDGLRAFAATGILMMHIASNSDYNVSGYIYNNVISRFGNFVFLFMLISAFGMCCGYYERVLENKISFSDFYGKRFKKILPFFACLVILDILISPSISSIYEGFADLTLLFGFLPNAGSIEVIGVGWFIGLIFVFYICFPFYCVLIQNKKRAIAIFIISLIYNFVCGFYFNVGRSNILYSSCFFIIGGIIYLFRNEILKFNKWIILSLLFISIIVYYAIEGNTITHLLVSSLFLIYAIISDGKILKNKVTSFISSVSMEIYLSHMVIFRIIEKLHLNTIFGNGLIQYIITVILVLAGAILFSIIMKYFIGKCLYKLKIK